ncbi:putative PGG domain-containing protein [Helianthus debilis subsp. tardiflorus]
MTQIKSEVHAIGKKCQKTPPSRKKPNQLRRHGNGVSCHRPCCYFYGDDGLAVVADLTSFKIFYLFNAMALYTSLGVVVIHMTLGIRGEKKAKKDKWLRLLTNSCS